MTRLLTSKAYLLCGPSLVLSEGLFFRSVSSVVIREMDIEKCYELLEPDPDAST